MMKKTVLSVQSHVVHGYVGNRCAVFPLQLLGFEVDFVNSVQFTNHTGYATFKGTVLRGPELDDLVEGLESNELLKQESLLTGYIGSATFLRSVLSLAKKLRAANPSTFKYLCDPVLGDNGKFYVPEELVAIYRTELLPKASVVTPNQFEIEKLAGLAVSSEDDAVKACQKLHDLGVPVVVITTLDYAVATKQKVVMMLSYVFGLAAAAEKKEQRCFAVEVPLLASKFTGSGDLTAALLLAWMRSHPAELPLALEKTAATVFSVLKNTLSTSRAPSFGVDSKKGGPPPELNVIGSKRVIEEPPVEEALVARMVSPPALAGLVFQSEARLKDARTLFPSVPCSLALPDDDDDDKVLLLVLEEEGQPYERRRCLTVLLGSSSCDPDVAAQYDLGVVSDLTHLRRFFPAV